MNGYCVRNCNFGECLILHESNKMFVMNVAIYAYEPNSASVHTNVDTYH